MNLSQEEREFLRGLLKGHFDYYQTLAGHPKCSIKNREIHAFIQTLWSKLVL